MTTPEVSHLLETALDQLEMAHNTLNEALHHAHHSALHSTYTAAINRILAFNAQTMISLRNLLATLRRQPSPTQL